MESGKLAESEVSLEGALKAAAKAASYLTRYGNCADPEDARQIAQLAVLEAYRAGKRGSFSYFYTAARRTLLNVIRGEQRHRDRNYAYSERLYGIDAVNPTAVQEQ